MKVFVGLVLGVITIGVLLTGAVLAVAWPLTSETEVVAVEDMQLPTITSYSRSDMLGIQVNWDATMPENTTYVLQRALLDQEDTWEDIATIAPGSRYFVAENEIEFLDTEVEHGVTYRYRIYMTIPGGGEGVTYVDTVTAIDPAR
jgi:hypothetical protein